MQIRFDDLRPDHRLSFAFADPVEILAAQSADEVPGVVTAAEGHALAGRWVAGFLSYEAASGFDPVLVTHPAGDLPLVWFAAFDERRVDSGPPDAKTNRMDGWQPDQDRATHAAALAAIHKLIGAGDTYQVNYTMRMRGRFAGDPLSAYADVVSAQSGGFGAFLDLGNYQILSASPELFFRWDEEGITTRPMKGTAGRGRWPSEDESQRLWLADSEKDRAENLMIVDLLRNDLGRIAQYGSVQVDGLFGIERFDTLWQMTSTVRATPRPEMTLMDVLTALFPSGSITGAPKARTMEIIRELETTPRGLYCGAVGLLAPPGSGHPRAQFNVAIRTVVIDGRTGTAEYGTGGGITWDSVAEREYDEALVKTAVLTHRPPEFSLLETMRWNPEQGVVRKVRHLSRLRASADYFGFAYPEERIEAELGGLEGDGQLRVRLIVDRIGRVTVEHEPLRQPADPVRLVLDSQAVDSDSVLLFHKTTYRDVYEQAAGRHPGADDVVLVNENGMATETTRANLAVRSGDTWVTPPLEDGCLPGVYRAELLDRGRLREQSVPMASLGEADELAVVSSLRGWRRAVLQAPGG